MDDSYYASFEYHFRQEGIEISEGKLIEILSHTKNRYKVHMAAILLSKYGTSAAIPALQKALYHPVQDVKTASLGSIAAICKGDGCHLYISALQDQQYREKGIAVWAIYEYCDEKGIEAVIARVKQMLSRKRCGIYYGPNAETEITYAITYLDRYSESHNEILALFAHVSDRWNFLWKHEQVYLQKNISFFKQR